MKYSVILDNEGYGIYVPVLPVGYLTIQGFIDKHLKGTIGRKHRIN